MDAGEAELGRLERLLNLGELSDYLGSPVATIYDRPTRALWVGH
jgi:hypothetical protein